MTETAGMRALLDLEDAAPDVLFETIPLCDVPLWPLARWPVSRALAETDIGTRLPTYRARGLKERAMLAVRHRLPNPHGSTRAPHSDHLFMVSGWTKNMTADGFANWLSDAFAERLGAEAVVVQDAYLDALSRGDQRPANPRTYSAALMNERVTHRAQRHPLPTAPRSTLERALRRVFELIDFPVTDDGRERAIQDALGRADRAGHAQREFSRLLDRIRPRRIYMQTAAYGNRAAEILLAHRRGIEVAELQHGWIGGSHAAYNAGAAMRRADLLACLPDTLLSYGEFWGRDIRFPGRVVPIGKPTLDPGTLNTPAWNDRPKRLLFVSSNFEHELVDGVLIRLREHLPADWTVVLRPHPVERSAAAARHRSVLDRTGIELDLTADAGRALAESRAVVGFSSTMLFEALGYGCHVGVVESALAEHYASAGIFPIRIGRDLSDAAAAAEAFLRAPGDIDAALSESVWRSGAVEAFLRFASS